MELSTGKALISIRLELGMKDNILMGLNMESGPFITMITLLHILAVLLTVYLMDKDTQLTMEIQFTPNLKMVLTLNH